MHIYIRGCKGLRIVHRRLKQSYDTFASVCRVDYSPIKSFHILLRDDLLKNMERMVLLKFAKLFLNLYLKI